MRGIRLRHLQSLVRRRFAGGEEEQQKEPASIHAGCGTMLRRFPILVAPLLTGACTAAETTSADRFQATGELVALSGGAAGAANACVTCHGLDGGGNGAGAPRLAGLDAGYLERQLIAYADGRRHHVQMSWIAKQMDADSKKAVSAHYAAMPWQSAAGAGVAAPMLWARGDARRGIMACAACHGQNGQGLGPANPPLAGQPAAYLAEQIAQWRQGRRRTDPGDVMQRISQLLTPAESRDLARYAASLAVDPPSPEPSEASLEARRGGPKSDASGPPLHVPESARAAQ